MTRAFAVAGVADGAGAQSQKETDILGIDCAESTKSMCYLHSLIIIKILFLPAARF